MNRLKGEVPLSLPDGRNFTLILDHEALILAEDTFGEPLHVLLARMQLGFVGAVRALLWAALQAKHSGVSKAEAAAMLFDHGDAVSAALNAASDAAAPDAQEGAEGNAPSRQAGKTSGGNGVKSGSNPKPSSKRPRAASH